eukprot:3113321-Amphidinium_carterae.3
MQFKCHCKWAGGLLPLWRLQLPMLQSSLNELDHEPSGPPGKLCCSTRSCMCGVWAPVFVQLVETFQSSEEGSWLRGDLAKHAGIKHNQFCFRHLLLYVSKELSNPETGVWLTRIFRMLHEHPSPCCCHQGR